MRAASACPAVFPGAAHVAQAAINTTAKIFIKVIIYESRSEDLFRPRRAERIRHQFRSDFAESHHMRLLAVRLERGFVRPFRMHKKRRRTFGRFEQMNADAA